MLIYSVMPLEFTKLVLNVHFRGSQFESFIRKLNRWCFTRCSINSEFPIYAVVHSHPMFQRDQPELIEKMTCVSKNKKRKERPSPTEEPKEAKESAAPPTVSAGSGVIDHLTSSLLHRQGHFPDQIREESLAQNIRLAEVLRGARPTTSTSQLLMDQHNLLSQTSRHSQGVTPIESFLLLEQERIALARNRSILTSQSNQMDYLLRRTAVDSLLGRSQYPGLLLGGFESSLAVGGLPPSTSFAPLLLSQPPGPIAQLLSSRSQQNRAHSVPQNSNSPSPSRDHSMFG